MNRQPLLLLSLFFMAGILLSEFFQINTLGWGLFLVSSVGFFFLMALKKIRFKRWYLFLCFISCVGLGAGFHEMNKMQNNHQTKLNSGEYVFHIKQKLNSNKDFKKYEIILVKGNKIKEIVPSKVVLSVPFRYPSLDFKHFYKANLSLKQVQTPRHNFLFDYSLYLARKGISHQAWMVGALEQDEKEMSFWEKLKQLRWQVLENINNSGLSARTKEFTKGIILADRTDMDADLVQDFNKTGLVHFLAISGTHMVIIFWSIMFLLKKILPNKYRKLAIVLALLFIWIFTLFIDFGNSVVRSSIMISVYYIYELIHRKPDLLHAMALAAIIILLFDSYALFDVGFQLSFVAVLGIFWLNPAFQSLFPMTHHPVKKFLYSLLTVSLSAQLATLPLVLYYFHQFSYLSLLANLFIVPFSEVIILFSLGIACLLGLGIELSIVNIIFDWVIGVLLKVIHFFATKDWAFQENIPMFFIEVILLFFALYFLRFALLKKESRSFIHMSWVLLFFLFLRMGLNWNYEQMNETISLQNKKQNIILEKKNTIVYVFVEDNTEIEPLKKYILNPYLSSRRISQYKIVKKLSD
ncbi:MAG: ComEC/Rec2 family competence protein [Bacteroidetes bacterium]|nr:ComEC/Rec2 family competence protein [Bacteroidota bacterium]